MDVLLFSKPPSESRLEYETKTTHMTCLKRSCAGCSSVVGRRTSGLGAEGQGGEAGESGVTRPGARGCVGHVYMP